MSQEKDNLAVGVYIVNILRCKLKRAVKMTVIISN
jgi:hypothetical protein